MSDLENHPQTRLVSTSVESSAPGRETVSCDELLADVLRGFHTIESDAGFLNVSELVELCHLTESAFDQIRERGAISQDDLDVLLAATAAVRAMFADVAQHRELAPCDPALQRQLRLLIKGSIPQAQHGASSSARLNLALAPVPDWNELYRTLIGSEREAQPAD